MDFTNNNLFRKQKTINTIFHYPIATYKLLPNTSYTRCLFDFKSGVCSVGNTTPERIAC